MNLKEAFRYQNRLQALFTQAQSILRSDDGIHWRHWITLEDSPVSQYSYPSIIQSRDGHLHTVYTWRRQRVKHVELIP